MKYTVPYSMGCGPYMATNEKRIYVYFFKIGQEIKCDEEYFLCADDGKILHLFNLNGNGMADSIFINFHSDEKYIKHCCLKTLYSEKIEAAFKEAAMLVDISISISKLGVLTMYVYDLDENDTGEKTCRVVELARLEELLEQTFIS